MSKYKCKKCKNNLFEKDAMYLHKKVGDLEPFHYYCKQCLGD